MPRILYLFCR